MYQIQNIINETDYNGVSVRKTMEANASEVLLICIEKGAAFKKHTSPNNAQLIVLEGQISFHINEETYLIKKHQTFGFPKNTEHWVNAIENSKFLIIR
ncbi:cupin domain-containing protein [Leptobacterium sp. I13]|uniref:cupin domain-containing protein n=1 Tax=Leptobacterium meishanense TaxID=3128904 RepID=UPI0030EEAAFB